MKYWHYLILWSLIPATLHSMQSKQTVPDKFGIRIHGVTVPMTRATWNHVIKFKEAGNLSAINIKNVNRDAFIVLANILTLYVDAEMENKTSAFNISNAIELSLKNTDVQKPIDKEALIINLMYLIDYLDVRVLHDPIRTLIIEQIKNKKLNIEHPAWGKISSKEITTIKDSLLESVSPLLSHLSTTQEDIPSELVFLGSFGKYMCHAMKNHLYILDLKNNKLIYTYTLPFTLQENDIYEVHDNSPTILILHDNAVYLFDIETRELTHAECPLETGEKIVSMSLSRDKKRLVLGTEITASNEIRTNTYTGKKFETKTKTTTTIFDPTKARFQVKKTGQ